MFAAKASTTSQSPNSLAASALNQFQSERQQQPQSSGRRFLFQQIQGPHERNFQPLPILRACFSAFSAIRYLPIFTPKATLSRWRSKRALRNAAREARDKRLEKRDWTRQFRLNGLTWHHLYISQDLRKIVSFLREIQNKPSAGDALIPLERSYAYLLDNVWDVYNSLERDVLFPWVQTGINGNPALDRALLLLSNERNRVEDAADVIQSKFSKLVCTTGYPYASLGPCSHAHKFNASRNRTLKRQREAKDSKARAAALAGMSKNEEDLRRKKASLCLKDGFQPSEENEKVRLKAANFKMRNMPVDEVGQITLDIVNLIEDTEKLHKTERQLLYPLIANNFPAKEQNRLTNVMVYSMRSNLAKFIITIYHQSVAKHDSRSQWKWYKREVPLPIRVYTPVWRARLFDDSPLGWLRSTPVKSLNNALSN